MVAVAPADRRRRLLPLFFLLTLLTGCQPLSPPPVSEPAAPSPPAPALRVSSGQIDDATPGGVRLRSPKAVRDFYQARHDVPAWQDAGRRDLLGQLQQAIDAAAADGLLPADYHGEPLAALRQQPAADHPHALETELLATDAFLTLASHARYGRIDLQAILPEWQPVPRTENFGALLEKALASGTIRQSLHELLPQDEGYRALRNALARLRQMATAGGWPTLPAGPTLKEGDQGARVALLRQRLAASGDLAPAPATAADRFDADLAAAVRRCQARHGLKADGLVAPETLAMLNVPLAERSRQVATNLERWRWQPRDPGRRHLAVNIPDFSLTVVEEGRVLLAMKVVAGRTDRPTPIFSSAITHLVLNPTWEVPHEIATKDLLPKIRKDPGYLQRFGFRVMAANSGNGQEIDPARIDWQRLTPAAFRYHLRQEPGPENFLGRVKFIFPNAHSVYLHDTPSKKLFARESRPFSSGCIRLEKPMELATLLLHDTPLGSEAALAAALAAPTRSVRLPAPLPLHLRYVTAWVDAEGLLQTRPDLYGHDRLIEEGLTGRAIRKPLPCLSECSR